MAARGVGFCNGPLSPTRLNSYQKPSHSALPHSHPCTPSCRYARLAFPPSEPGGNLPAAPHHSHPLPAVLLSPSNRSVLHVPSQRAASAIAARCIGHRTALRFPGQDTALCPSPHFLATASALRFGWKAPARSSPPPIQKRKAVVLQQKHHGLLFPESGRPLRARPIPDAKHLFPK